MTAGSSMLAITALVFLGSQFIGKKTITERIMGDLLEAPPNSGVSSIWRQLNLMWVANNFTILAVANVYVVYNYDMDTWTLFKTFGTIGVTLVTAVGQAIWIALHAPPEQRQEESQ